MIVDYFFSRKFSESTDLFFSDKDYTLVGLTIVPARGVARGSTGVFPRMGPRGDTGTALARLRELRVGFNANQLKEVSERWARCRDSACNEREHSTVARALEVLSLRAAEGVRAKGAPSRGGPVRAEIAAVLRSVGTFDAIAYIVASPNLSTAFVACTSLEILLGVVNTHATRPSAVLIAALAVRVVQDEPGADVRTALAAAQALKRLTDSRQTLDDDDVVEAVRAANVVPTFAKRLVDFAKAPTRSKLVISMDAVAPCAIAAAAFASRRDLWDFLDAPTEVSSAQSAPTASVLAEALVSTATRCACEERFDAAAAVLDTAALLVATRHNFREALCRPESGFARATDACVKGVGFLEADISSSDSSAAAAASAFRALAAATPDLAAPMDDEWKPTIEALVRGVAAHGESARSGAGDNCDAQSRREAAAMATVAVASLLMPKRWVYGAPHAPPAPWRASLLAAGLVKALCETTGAWADAGIMNRGLAAVAQTPIGGVGWNGRGGPEHAWCAVERLVVPGETPCLGTEDAAALTRAALAAVALVAPPSTRREQVVSSILAPSESRSQGAPPPLVAGAGAGARDSVAEAAASAAGRVLCALLECDATRAVATRALEETRNLLGGDEWTMCVGRHLSLGVGATPAKACLAAALARLPTGRGALVESGAVTRVCCTLVELVSSAKAAAASRRAETLGETIGESEGENNLDEARDARRFESRAGFVDESSVMGLGDDSYSSRNTDESFLFAPFRWRTGDASLIAASLKALVELVAPRETEAPGDKSVSSTSSSNAETLTSLPAALRETLASSLPISLPETLAALASEAGAASFGGDAGDEIRCWSLLACRCVGADASVGSVGGAARVAHALKQALPDQFKESGDDVDEIAVLSASTVSPPDVCFVLHDGTRQPAHAAVLNARCPALLPAMNTEVPPAGTPNNPDLNLSPKHFQVLKLGHGVTPGALRAVLEWVYAGALTARALEDGDSENNKTNGLETNENETVSLRRLARKCGTHELSELARGRRPKLGAYTRCLTDSLVTQLRSGRCADVETFAEETREDAEERDENVSTESKSKSTREAHEKTRKHAFAHRVILCARVSFFRAALDTRHGFTESVQTWGGVESTIRLRCPVTSPESLEALLVTLYSGSCFEFFQSCRRVPLSHSKETAATTAINLAAGLEYLMLHEEADECALFVVFASGAADWRERLGGVRGALRALSAAAAHRRWSELDALLGVISENAYQEAVETAPDLWQNIHPELREAMRRAHVQRTRALRA